MCGTSSWRRRRGAFVFGTILTVDDKFLRVSLQVLPPQRVHGVRKAAFGHESVNVTQLVGAGLHHLLLRHRQRLHAQHLQQLQAFGHETLQ